MAKRHESFFAKLQPWHREEGAPFEIQCLLGGGTYGQVFCGRATSGRALKLQSASTTNRSRWLSHCHFR